MAKSVRWLNGYKLVYCPNDPRAMSNSNWNGYVYEHIKIAQGFMGRPLRSNEEVHHLDGNRANNSKANLLVLERSQHTKLHSWLKGAVGKETSHENGVNSVKPESSGQYDCPVCGSALPSSRHKTCSVECAKVFRRKVDRPTEEQLMTDVATMPMTKVGNKYGVSDNAVRKWVKSYEDGQY